MIVATHAVDTIAIIILIAMMLVPLANIVTGAIVGTGLGGPLVVWLGSSWASQ